MPLLGQGVLAIWHTITPEGELEYWRWHDREHIPERVGVPGFLRGRRYRSLERSLDYLDLYEVEGSETLRSAPYLARLNGAGTGARPARAAGRAAGPSRGRARRRTAPPGRPRSPPPASPRCRT
jgi:hypothetical protein